MAACPSKGRLVVMNPQIIMTDSAVRPAVWSLFSSSQLIALIWTTSELFTLTVLIALFLELFLTRWCVNSISMLVFYLQDMFK